MDQPLTGIQFVYMFTGALLVFLAAWIAVLLIGGADRD